MNYRILKSCVVILLVTILAAPVMAGDVGDVWFDKKTGVIEFVNGGDVAALQFDINVGQISERAYSCGGNLPESFIASCFLNDGSLRVVVFSMENAPIPDSTLVSFNKTAKTLSAASSAASGQGIENVVFSDANGRDITPKHL